MRHIPQSCPPGLAWTRLNGKFGRVPARGSGDDTILRHFEDGAAAYATYVAPCFDPVADHLLSELSREVHRPRLIVDVGCGDGRLAARLSPVCPVVAVERSSALLRRAVAHTPTVSWIRADAHRLPLADNCADVVICSMSLPFFGNPHAALAEMARIVRPAGSVVVAFGQGPVFPARRIVRLAKEIHLGTPADLVGFLAGQISATAGPFVPSEDQAAEVIARNGGELRLRIEMTLMYLDPATIGGYSDES